MNKIYIVTFERHINCQIRDMVFHCEAQNAKEAVQIAKDKWFCDSHQFHIHATKSRIQDPSLLSVHTWNNHNVSGTDCLGYFYCTDFRTWRVNGINQYGTKAGQHYRA